jgi:hypothetical protein
MSNDSMLALNTFDPAGVARIDAVTRDLVRRRSSVLQKASGCMTTKTARISMLITTCLRSDIVIRMW